MTRLLIVGFDGASFDVIRPMIADGELPHVARVLAEGASGELESETPPTSPPAWTSMMTGLNPGRHGVYHFIRRRLGSYETPLVDSRIYSGKDLMSVLTRRGWTAGTMNIPMTYPPFPLEGGYMVSGIPMPLEGESIAWPAGLTREMSERLGHPFRPDVDFAPFEGDLERDRDDLDLYERLRDDLFSIERDRMELAAAYLKDRPTDLGFFVVSVTDRAQHYFWRFQDPSHPGYSEEGRARFGSVIPDAYRMADEFLGRVREAAEDAAVCLVSDHGFGPYSHDFHINTWLEREGLLVRREPPYWTWGRTSLADALTRAGLGAVGRALGPVGRLRVARPKRKARADLRDVDWSRTRAYCALHGICLNLKGREPEGVVAPGEEARRLKSEIAQKLKRLEGPDGEPAVDFVVLAEEFYSGPFAEEAPDIQFQLMGLACLPKDDWGRAELFAPRRTSPISGQHRFNGIFALSGPGVRAGARIEGMHIRDAAPTLLHAVGEKVCGWMEGRVQAAAFEGATEPDFAHEEEPQGGEGAGAAFTDEQAAAVEESLRGLGYLQ